MKILMVGPIGSGKSTQAKILSQELAIPLIQTGDLIRNRAKEDDETGNLLKFTLKTGHMAPDTLMADLFKEELNKLTGEDFIIDCYPRRLSQLNVYDPQVDKVIYLDIPDSELEQRLLSRGRADDKPEVIKKRLEVYHKETVPLLEHYRMEGILEMIDGRGSIDEVKDRIKKALKIS